MKFIAEESTNMNDLRNLAQKIMKMVVFLDLVCTFLILIVHIAMSTFLSCMFVCFVRCSFFLCGHPVLPNLTLLFFICGCFGYRWPFDAVHRCSTYQRKNDNWRRRSFEFSRRVTNLHSTQLHNCISCSLSQRKGRLNSRRSIPRAFTDKSAFHLSKLSLNSALVSCSYYLELEYPAFASFLNILIVPFMRTQVLIPTINLLIGYQIVRILQNILEVLVRSTQVLH